MEPEDPEVARFIEACVCYEGLGFRAFRVSENRISLRIEVEARASTSALGLGSVRVILRADDMLRGLLVPAQILQAGTSGPYMFCERT